MSTHTPTIIKRAEQLLLALETAVRGFDRYHKYAIGHELRQQARAVIRHAMAAWRDRENRAGHVAKLVESVASLKIEMQLAQNLRAFKSFGQFESIYEVVEDVSKQCGGWSKELHRQSQSAQNTPSRSVMAASAQRAHRLSADTASTEAHL